MSWVLPNVALSSVLCLFLACAGKAESPSGDGDSSTGDGDGDAGDGDTGDGDGGDGDGDVTSSGGTAGDGDVGDGDGSGGQPGVGLCFDQSCGGNCVPAGDGGPSCGGNWECLATFTCAKDLASYCGCNGETFQGSSDCAPYAYFHKGECDAGIGDGFNCNHAQVMTDDLPPTCGPGEIPSVAGGTWGPCVPLTDCGCENSNQCGDGLSYACYTAGHCGELLH